MEIITLFCNQLCEIYTENHNDDEDVTFVIDFLIFFSKKKIQNPPSHNQNRNLTQQIENLEQDLETEKQAKNELQKELDEIKNQLNDFML